MYSRRLRGGVEAWRVTRAADLFGRGDRDHGDRGAAAARMVDVAVQNPSSRYLVISVGPPQGDSEK